MNTLLSECGVRYVDHLAVTTPDLARTLAEFLGLPGARLLKGPGWNPEQKVHYAFVQVEGGPVIELLSGVEGSPVLRHIRQGGGPYHFCYAVADLPGALARARELGAAVVSEPTPDVAFDGRSVAFLFHRLLGLFELVEAFPPERATEPVAIPRGREAPPVTPDGTDMARLEGVFLALFPALSAENARKAALDETEGWDSLAQIQLMMDIEREFGVDFAAQDINRARSFEAVASLLSTMLKQVKE